MRPIDGNTVQLPKSKRIVFLGDSITDNGTYISYLDAYFLQYLPDRQLTFINLGVSSETASGLSEPDHPFRRPCIHDRLTRAMEESKPDWVVICYGMNDGIFYPFSEERFTAYKEGIVKVIRAVQQRGAKAIVMTPPPFDPQSMKGAALLPYGETKYSYMAPYEHYNEVLGEYAKWLLSLHSEVESIVPIYEPLVRHITQERGINLAYTYGDGIHPNADGHWVIAKTLLKHLFNISVDRIPDFVHHPEASPIYPLVWERHRILSSSWKEHIGHTNVNKAEALPLDAALQRGERLARRIVELSEQNGIVQAAQISTWKDYQRIDFYVEGREGLLIVPKSEAPGKPWIWRAEFFDAFAAADMALLEQGWTLAYYRISDMYGCPYAVELMHGFHNHLIDAYGLSAKTVLFGFSRGGLYSLHYAAAYPNSVAALYLDAPVLDIRSWPGGKGSGIGSPDEWKDCLALYGFTEESAELEKYSPLDPMSALAASKIPVLIVAGDADEVVPLSENGDILVKQYRNHNSHIEIIRKPGVGHHPHSLEEPAPIVNFVKQFAARAD